MTEERKRLHKNTHNWKRIRARKIALAAVSGKNGQRGKLK